MLYKLITTLLCIFILTGCSDDYIEPNEPAIDMSQLVLDEKDFMSVISQLEDYLNTSSKRFGTSGSVSNAHDSNISQILNPMLENGEDILTELQGAIYRSDLYADMTTAEKQSLAQEIDNLTEQQLVELSMNFNISYYLDNEILSEVDMDLIMSCGAVAVGIVAIRDLFYNTIGAGSITSMIGALKHIGRRYLGWFGVAAMIYEFANCMYDRT